MNRTTALIGGILIAGGIGGGAYAFYRYQQSKTSAGLVSAPQVTVTPLPLPAAATLATVTVGWTNPSASAANYGVQAAWLEEVSGTNGVISGHLFTSQTLAQQAVANPSAAGALVTTPVDRVATVAVAAGATGTVNLYGYFDPTTAVGPFALVAWIVPNPPTNSLLANDPTGQQASRTTTTGRFTSQVLATA